MIPERPSGPPHALRKVMELPTGGPPVRLRALLHDGSVVEGELVAVSPEHLSLLSPSDELRYVPADQVNTLYLGERRSFREFLVLAAVICVTTAAVVAAAQVPYLREHLRWVAVQLCVLAIAGLLIARRSTRLGDWLTSWVEFVGTDERRGQGPGT